jgi:hypothetical protein
MNHEEKSKLPPGLEEQWREWAEQEPAIDEVQLKRNLRQRIPGGRPRPLMRWVGLAAAASLLAVIVGVETLRGPSGVALVDEPALIHELGHNTILILREGGEPIQVVIDQPEGESGGR